MGKKIAFVLGLIVCGLILGVGIASLFGSKHIAELKQQQLASQQRYESDLARLTKQLADAQTQAAVAVNASRDASEKLATVNSGIDQLVKSTGRFDSQIRDGLKGDIDLVDRCITDLDRYQTGLRLLQKVSSQNRGGTKGKSVD
ncbi:MAG: hypothetical protein HKM05_08855 [Spirochaetales bacterium]|nr:hypothetical protein [Spirochaetales bacterium]